MSLHAAKRVRYNCVVCSYLPQGSQGLKAVTKAKLGYEPVEVDAEDMTRYRARSAATAVVRHTT